MNEFQRRNKILDNLPRKNNDENIAKFNKAAELVKDMMANKDIDKSLHINTPMNGRGMIKLKANKCIHVIDCKHFAEALKLVDFYNIFPDVDGNITMLLEVKNISEIEEGVWK